MPKKKKTQLQRAKFIAGKLDTYELNGTLIGRLKAKLNILPTAADYGSLIRYTATLWNLDDENRCNLRINMGLKTYAQWAEYLKTV